MASRLIRLFVVFAMLACAPLAQEHAGPHWSYRGADGPKHWGELDKGFATCQAGHQQSPNRGYYTFIGSLTTPPCTEHVTWFVLKAPEPISQRQADALGRILSE